MPKISAQQRDARREQIVSAAWQCFERRGIHETSMEEIIREAGLSAGAVYLYFDGKEQLILSAIETHLAALSELLTPLLQGSEGSGPLEFVQAATATISRFTRRKGTNLTSVILMCWSEAQTNGKVKALIRGFQVNYRSALSRLAAQWQRSGLLEPAARPEDVAKVMLCLFMGFIAQSALLGQVDASALAVGMRGLARGEDWPWENKCRS